VVRSGLAYAARVPTSPRIGLRAGLAASAVVGIVLALAFPPYGLWPLAPLCVAVATRLARDQPIRRALLLGQVMGLAFFALLLRWMLVIGADAWLLLSALEAVFVALLFAGLTLVQRLRLWPLWTACLWVTSELARSHAPFGGFPWGRLAFAQADAPFAPYAALGGMPVLSFAVALCGALLLAAGGRGIAAASRLALLGAVLAVPLLAFAVPVPTGGRQVAAAVVQGNVPRSGLDAFGQRAAVLDNHVEATRSLAAEVAAGRQPKPDLVIWPENSSDIDPYVDGQAAAAIQGAVDAIGVPTLVGAVVANPADPHTVLNVGIVWAPSAAAGGGGAGERYAKRHPVPFGEYIPFRSLLTRWITRLDRIPEDFAPGTRPGLLDVGGVRIGDAICFEVAYDGIVRDVVGGDPQVLVVQTNNATYGRTGQPDQQLAMSQLRAIETGRSVLVAATSGLSAVIAPDGRLVAHSAEFERWVYDGPVTLRTGETLAARVGDWPEWILGILGVGAIALAITHRRRERNPASDASTLQPA
jgi:apolipoprotein N-acyltransferase